MHPEAHADRIQPTPVASRLRRWRRRAAFCAIQVIVILTLLELLGRALDPLGISYYPETARLMDSNIIDEPLGYRLRPGLHARFHGADVRINEWGLREREIPQSPPNTEFRILVMGDSVPFGIGVEFEDSIPQVLQRIANENAVGERRYRTINMGVPSYNTEQELAQLESLGLRLEPGLVLLWYSWNDVHSRMWVYEKRAGLLTNLAQRSYAASLLAVLAQEVRARLRGRTVRAIYRMYHPDHPRWRAVEQALISMNQTCRAEGIPFAVFVPVVDQPQAMGLLMALGRREGFPVLPIDPFADPRWADADPRRFRNSVVDNHRNRDGCRILGTLVYEHLRREELLP